MFEKFSEIWKMELKRGLSYKFEFMFSIITSPMILIMFYFIWQSVYSNTAGGEIAGYSFTQMMTYYVVGMIINHFIFTMIGSDLQDKILYGELSQDILKPIPFFNLELSRHIADRTIAVATEVVPVFLITFVLFNLRIAGAVPMVFFTISLILAFFINFLTNYLMGLLAFWISKIESMQWMMFIVIRFLSGEFLPLELLGTVVFTISRFLPFFYIRYAVIQQFLGTMTIKESIITIAIQAAWIIVLYFVSGILWKKGLKRYGAQGG